ncbi:hypothetical protein [Streptomyces sp. NBC_00467]
MFEDPVRRRGRRPAGSEGSLPLFGVFDPPVGGRELLDLDAAQEVEQLQR